MKKLLLLLSVMTIILSSVCFATTFNDLTKDHWAYTPIIELADKGVLKGYPDGSFQPNGTITRAEFAKILVLSLDLTKSQVQVEFEDVPREHWAYDYVKVASDYLTGYTNGNVLRYMPDSQAVREDMTVAIVNAAGLQNAKYSLDTLNRFSDKDEISDNFKKYVAIAVENNLMRGNADGTFNPRGSLTRAQVCQLMKNALEYLEKVPISELTPVPTGTPKPTSTAKPTNTPKPTDTPKPTNTATPTSTIAAKGNINVKLDNYLLDSGASVSRNIGAVMEISAAPRDKVEMIEFDWNGEDLSTTQNQSVKYQFSPFELNEAGKYFLNVRVKYIDGSMISGTYEITILDEDSGIEIIPESVTTLEEDQILNFTLSRELKQGEIVNFLLSIPKVGSYSTREGIKINGTQGSVDTAGVWKYFKSKSDGISFDGAKAKMCFQIKGSNGFTKDYIMEVTISDK